MNWEQILKWGALAGGAYYLYAEYFAPLPLATAGGPEAPGTASGPAPPDLSGRGATPPAGNTPGAAPPDLGTSAPPPAFGRNRRGTSDVVAPPADLLARIKARMGASSRLNAHQWNWAYQQETGSAAPAPDPLMPARSDGQPWTGDLINSTVMSADDWWRYIIQGSGLAGISYPRRTGGPHVTPPPGGNYSVN